MPRLLSFQFTRTSGGLHHRVARKIILSPKKRKPRLADEMTLRDMRLDEPAETNAILKCASHVG